MKKIILASISNILMIVLPLMGKPSLILNGKILFLIAGSVCMWLTQPPVSVKETSDQKNSDRFSVVLILQINLILLYLKTNTSTRKCWWKKTSLFTVTVNTILFP